MSNLLKSKLFLGVMVAFVFAVVASTASAAYMHTTTLKYGSRGASVTELQGALGVTPMSGYFGNITKAAVMAFQSSHALTADGVVGPMTGAAISGMGSTVGGTYPAGCTSASGFSTTTGMSCAGGMSYPAGCTSTVGFSPTTGMSCSGAVTTTPSGPLVGTAGNISDINRLSSYNSEDVGAGQKDVKVLGFEIEASNDGDIALNSMKLRFDSTGNGTGDSDRIEDYLSKVTIWQGSTVIASANMSEFTKDSTGLYTKTLSLSNSVVRADKIEKFYVSVDALTNLDSGDINSDSWTIALDNVRFVDGGGVTTTETVAIPTDMDWDSAGDGVGIEFVSFSTASDTELKISDTTSPDAQVVKVSTSSDTNNVVLLKGKMKLDGTSNVWLDSIPFSLTAASVGTGDGSLSIDALASSVTLTLGSNTYTESLGSNCTTSCATQTTDVVTFDNLDYTVTAGSTVNFTLTADINDIEDTAVTSTDMDEGDNLVASLSATNRGNMVVENSEGDQLTDATEVTGSVTGNAQSFYSKGINVKLVTTSAAISHAADLTVSTDDDQGTFALTFDVTAFGSDIWVDSTAPSLTGGTTESDIDFTTTGTVALTSATISSPTGADATGGTGFKIDEDTTERFTISAVGTISVDGFVRISLTNLRYALTNVSATTSYTFDLADYKTADLFLNAN